MATVTEGEDIAPKNTVSIEFLLGEKKERSEWRAIDNVASMKQSLAVSHHLSVDDITLSYNDELLSDATTVEELGADATGLTLLVGVSPSPSRAMRGVANVLTVCVDDGREVCVSVERETRTKPFLGGFKHKVSGVQFHNASAQTMRKSRGNNDVVCYERDTQTVVTRNKPQQIYPDAATQMNKTGCFMSSRDDKLITITGVYETAEAYHARLLHHVLILQTHWRAWLARRYVNGLRSDKVARQEWEEQEALRRVKEREERTQREFERRMNPQTKEDFELLYHALEMWRQDELATINHTTSGPARKAALCQLLDQEAQLIASISKHKIQANKQHKNKTIQRFLNATAAPKRWTAYDGRVTEMDTQFSLRAQQLRDIHQSITMNRVSADERLDILLTLKCTVKEHDCTLTRELVELVDREADLIVRGLDNGDTLKGLRGRIAALFYQYCKVPLFNPEAAKHIPVPQDPATLRTNIYYCKSCCRYLASTEFELSTNSRAVGNCRSCRELDNRARARDDLTLYRAMLSNIRTTEESIGDTSTVIFLIQESDLRYLVENIWAAQSALSAVKELFELVLVRWDKDEQWTPWNTILLTREEAKGHTSLTNVHEAYGVEFVRKVHYRHVLAKSYFSRIPGMTEALSDKVKTLPLPKPTERELTVSLAKK